MKRSRKRNRIFIVLIMVSLLFSLALPGCSVAQNGATGNAGKGNSENAQGSAASKTGYVSITAQEAKEVMDSNSQAIILDVRTRQEYDQGHIPGAICVPVEEIGAVPPSELPDKDATILVYCRSGNRSKQASEKLVALGYTDIREFGGINSWPYETTQ